MKITNQKSNSKKVIIGLSALLILVALFFYFYLSGQKNNEQNIPVIKETPISTGSEGSINLTTDADTQDKTIDQKTPTKTPGKTPAQYENESIDDKPAYENEQFRIPEEE